MEGGFFSLSLRQIRLVFLDMLVPTVEDSDIHYWEVFAVFALLTLYPDSFRGVHLVVDIDNPGASASVNRQRGPSGRTDMQDLIERCVLISIDIGCRLSSEKVVGDDIPEADSLSRKDVERFHELLTEYARGRGGGVPHRFAIADAGA